MLRGRAAFVALAVSGALVLVLVLVAVVVALPPSLSSESSRSISATDGGIVAIGDQLTVRIPAGALSADSTVTIRRATDATRPTATLEAGIAVGGAHTIELSEATLQRPVVLEIAFDPAKLPKGSPREIVFAASYDEAAQRWVPVYGRVDPTRNVVIIETDHLSWWQPWTWDIPKLVLAISLRIEKLGSVIGIPTPEIPRCAALSLHTTYESSSALIGCLERTGNEGEALVRLANNRLYGILIDPPAGARHLSTSRGSFSDAVWAQVVPALQGRLVYVPPAGEARFILSLNKGDEVRFLSIISNKTLAFDIGLVIPDLLGWDPKSARAILPCAFPFGGPAQPVSVSSSLALEVLRECAGVALEAEADRLQKAGNVLGAASLRTAAKIWFLLQDAIRLVPALTQFAIDRGELGTFAIAYRPPAVVQPASPPPPAPTPPAPEATPARAATPAPTAAPVLTPAPTATPTPTPTQSPTPSPTAATVVYVVETGVDPSEEIPVRGYVEFARDYLGRTFQWELTGTYRVTLSADTSGPTASAGRDGMWINVNGTEWRRARTTGTAEKIVVHELFHALQLRRGWARAAPSWLFEGAAEYVAWRGALVEKGVYSADVARGCHIWGVHYSISAAGQPAPIGRLQEYEAGFPLDVPVYSLFYLAVDFLMQSHPITALVSVQDTDFETTFGRSLPSFYSDFEEYRSTWTLPSSTDNYQCN